MPGEDHEEKSPSDQTTCNEPSTPSQHAGRTLGPYHLLQMIGEGGMGEVWLAQQTTPIRRRVAVKVIKRGMDSKQVIARFEAERQALALMDHPAIAKVFDAGETPLGRPFFVMEYVQGVPITEHCDRQRLSMRERLDLFVQICDGVQHAHQKAIIHRDLKPQNVLVFMQDGKATPKIIDFGVAKATAQRLTEKTLFTELGMLIGTPEYMSPEQAEMTAQDVDTRTDVYSLGVILYELLVGALPFDPKVLREAGFDGIRKKIREEEPPKPSMRLSTLGGEACTESARRRHVDVPTLARQLVGDLDWITMKCLEKERSRRYSSSAELAADVVRHLAHQPVLASPPSAAYRARKFARRHRIGVGAAAAGVLVICSFAGTMAWQAGRIARQRDRADLEARTATRSLEFLTKLFKVSDPREARGNAITAREILDRGAKQLDSELAGEPATQAKLMFTIGEVYFDMGLYEPAAALLDRSLSLRRGLFGDDHVDTLESMDSIAIVLKAEGKLKEAEPYGRQALEGRRRVLGNDHPDTLKSINNMGVYLREQGKFKDAEPYLREALEGRRRVLGNEHPDTLESIDSMGQLLNAQGKLKESEPYWREALETRRRVLGKDHPDTLRSISNMGFLLQSKGQLKEAEPYWREALEGHRRVHGNDHPTTLVSINNMGALLDALGRLKEAEPYYREALETRRRVLGNDHPDTLVSLNNMGFFFRAQGQFKEAEPYWREALERRRRLLGNDHPSTLTSINNMGVLLQQEGRLKEAEPFDLEALETRRRVLGNDHPDTLSSMATLGDLYTSEGRVVEAEPLLRDAVEHARKALPSGHRVAGKALKNYGRCLTSLKRYADAEAALVEAHGILVAADVVMARNTAEDLVALYEVWRKPDKAAAWKLKASPT